MKSTTGVVGALHIADATTMEGVSNSDCIDLKNADKINHLEKKIAAAQRSIVKMTSDLQSLKQNPSSIKLNCLNSDIKEMNDRDFSINAYFERRFLHIFLERAVWVVALMTLASFSVLLLDMFSEDLKGKHGKRMTLFLPMILGTAGNCGNQVGITLTRALSNHELDSRIVLKRLIKRESLLAFAMSCSLASVAFLRCSLDPRNTPKMSYALSITMFLVSFTAVSIGITSSIIVYRLGLDPAAGASPLFATVSDLVSVFVYCVIVSLIL